MAGLEVMVGGRWLALDVLYGDVEMSTCCPGGSDQLSWTSTAPSRPYRGGEDVRAYFGSHCVWAGSLLEPDPSQDQLTATGAFREGAGFAAMAAGIATAIPDTAIDRAIGAGLRWTRPSSISSSAAKVDITQGPIFLDALLDTFANDSGMRWGVNALREVFVRADNTSPSYQTLPLEGGPGYALDGYASTLIGRYLDSATSTYKTATVTDATAEANHGHVEQLINLTTRGAITTAQATSQLNGLLTLGAAVPSWISSEEFSYGEILTMGGTAVALETVAAGALLRVHGGASLPQRLNGQLYVDLPIGTTTVSEGTLKIGPAQLAIRTLADFVAGTPAA